jgi:short-subunit dehydrogenase
MATHAAKTALITGASSTFGAAYARGLAERGHDLILVGRKEGRLRSVAADVVERTRVDVQILVADLADPVQLAQVEERLRTDESIDTLVNSAGAAKFAPIAGFDPTDIGVQVALNITAPTRLVAAAVGGMTQRGRGTIVNVSSALAFFILPVSAVYSATKGYVLTFTQALRQELSDSGIRVQAVIPGAMHTEFWDGSGFALSGFPDANVMSPEDAVAAALAGLDAGEPVTIPSLENVTDWEGYERARDKVAPVMSRAAPADRYRH